MNRDDAVLRVQEGLGFRTDLSDAIIRRLQEAQRRFEKGQTLPWFLIEEDATLSGTANDGTLAAPTGFLKFVEDELPSVVTTEGRSRFLRRVAYDWLQDYSQSDDEGTTRTGDPVYFALRSDTLEVSPVPEASYTVTLSYFKAGADLTANSTSTWLDNIPELIIGWAGMSLAKDLRDGDAVASFKDLHDSALASLIREMADREQSGREMFMGGQA